MKIVLTLLCFAIIAEVSLASTTGRNKRSAWDKGDLKILYEKTIQWMEQANIIVKGVVRELPTNVEYSNYKIDFESFLENYEEQKTKIEGCFPNLYQAAQEIAHLYTPLERDDASAEAKVVQRLSYKHGLKELKNDADEFFKTFNMEALKQSVESWTPEEKKEMLDKCKSLNGEVTPIQ